MLLMYSLISFQYIFSNATLSTLAEMSCGHPSQTAQDVTGTPSGGKYIFKSHSDPFSVSPDVIYFFK